LWLCALLPELGQSGKEHDIMPALMKTIWNLRICRDTQGQDLLEYALIAGFLACACAAALPDIGSSVLTVFSKVLSVLSPVGGDGSGGASLTNN
jgi:pilus assembly protein Flp/PilA